MKCANPSVHLSSLLLRSADKKLEDSVQTLCSIKMEQKSTQKLQLQPPSGLHSSDSQDSVL